MPNPNKDGAMNAAILPICRTKDNRYFAILGIQKYLDTFGGKLNEDELAEDGVIRELHEESLNIFQCVISKADLLNPKKTKQLLASQKDNHTRVFVTVFQHHNPFLLLDQFHQKRWHPKNPLTNAQKEKTSIRVIEISEFCNYIAAQNNNGLLTMQREAKRNNDKVITPLSVRHCVFNKLDLHFKETQDFLQEIGAIKVVYSLPNPLEAKEQKREPILTAPLVQKKSNKQNGIKLYFEFEQNAIYYLNFIRKMLPEFKDELQKASVKKSKPNFFRFRLTDKQYTTYNQRAFVIKTIRSDTGGFFRHFVLGITRDHKQQNKPMMRAPKRRFTVTGSGVQERSKKLPRFTPRQKQGFSYQQSISLFTLPQVDSSIYGSLRAQRATKLVGVRLPLTEVLINRLFLKDAGTRGRPYDHSTYEEALEYHQIWSGENEPVLLNNVLKYQDAFLARKLKIGADGINNEALARLRWNFNNCSICIFSDSLEARLLAQDYARILYLELQAQAKATQTPLPENYQVPITFFLPDNPHRNNTSYNKEEQTADRSAAEKICKDKTLFQQKINEDNFEILLGLDDPTDFLKTPQGNTAFILILQKGYFHIAESLVQKDGDHGRCLELKPANLNTVMVQAIKHSSFTFVDWLFDVVKKSITLNTQDRDEFIYDSVCTAINDLFTKASEDKTCNIFAEFRFLIEGFLNRLSEGLTQGGLAAENVFKILTKEAKNGVPFGHLLASCNKDFFILQYLSWLNRFVHICPHEILNLLKAKDINQKNLAVMIFEFYGSNSFIKEELFNLIKRLLWGTRQPKAIIVILNDLKLSAEQGKPTLLLAYLSLCLDLVELCKPEELTPLLLSQSFNLLVFNAGTQKKEDVFIKYIALLKALLQKKISPKEICQILPIPAAKSATPLDPAQIIALFTEDFLKRQPTPAMVLEYCSFLTPLGSDGICYITKPLIQHVVLAKDPTSFATLLPRTNSENILALIHNEIAQEVLDCKDDNTVLPLIESYLNQLSQNVNLGNVTIETIFKLLNSFLRNGSNFFKLIADRNSDKLMICLLQWLKKLNQSHKSALTGQVSSALSHALSSRKSLLGLNTLNFISKWLVQYVIDGRNSSLLPLILTMLRPSAKIDEPLTKIHSEVCCEVFKSQEDMAVMPIVTEYLNFILESDVDVDTVLKTFNTIEFNGYNLCQLLMSRKSDDLPLHLLRWLNKLSEKNKEKVAAFMQPSFTKMLLARKPSKAVITKYLSLLQQLSPNCFHLLNSNLIYYILRLQDTRLLVKLQYLISELIPHNAGKVIVLLQTSIDGLTFPEFLVLCYSDPIILNNHQIILQKIAQIMHVAIDDQLTTPKITKEILMACIEKITDQPELIKLVTNALNPQHALGSIFWQPRAPIQFFSRLRPRPTHGLLKRICNILDAIKTDLSIKVIIKIIQTEKLTEQQQEGFAWMKNLIKNFILKQEEPLKSILLTNSIDPNHPLGKIFWTARGLTEPTLEKGTLKDLRPDL